MCKVPMSVLLNEPYNLNQSNIVQARVICINNIGASVPSAANSFGAIVEQVPHKPLVAPIKNPLTTQNTLVVDYKPLVGTADGGSSILSYKIWWD